MFGSLLILLALPILDTSRLRGNQFRPLMKLVFWFFVVTFFILLWIGSQHPNTPYLEIGQIFTFYYFAHFLFVVPAVGILENTLHDVNAHQLNEQNKNTIHYSAVNSANPQNINKKTIFSRIVVGIHKGYNTPTLPQYVLDYQNTIFVRIFRVLGGISIFALVSSFRYHISYPTFLMYTLFFIVFLFWIYTMIIFFIRINHILKLLKSNKLDVVNSPFDRLATEAARAFLCFKGLCESAWPIGATMTFMVTIDAMLINSNRPAFFSPRLLSILPEPKLSDEAQLIADLKNQFKELETIKGNQANLIKFALEINKSTEVPSADKTVFQDFLLKEYRNETDKGNKILESVKNLQTKWK